MVLGQNTVGGDDQLGQPQVGAVSAGRVDEETLREATVQAAKVAKKVDPNGSITEHAGAIAAFVLALLAGRRQ